MKQVSVKKALQAWKGIQPISEKDRERLSRRFTIDYNYNSNHIEGNTLTYGQTEILLLFGKVIGEATVRDIQEMTASNVGLKMMTEEAKTQDMPLTQNFIRTSAHCIKHYCEKIILSIVTCPEVSKRVIPSMPDNIKRVLTRLLRVMEIVLSMLLRKRHRH